MKLGLLTALLLSNLISGLQAQKIDITVKFSGNQNSLDVYLTAREQDFTSETFRDFTLTIHWPTGSGYNSLGNITFATSEWGLLTGISAEPAAVNGDKNYQTFLEVDGERSFGENYLGAFILPTLTENVETHVFSIDVSGAWTAGLSPCDFKWYEDNYISSSITLQHVVRTTQYPGSTGDILKDPIVSEYDGSIWTDCPLSDLQPMDTAIINSSAPTPASLSSETRLATVIVRPGATLEVASGGNLTADSLFLIEADNTGYGQLTGVGDVNSPVTAQVYLDAANPGRWFSLGSPFTNATFEEFNEGNTLNVLNNSTSPSVYGWDASSASWAAVNDVTDAAEPGKGYSFFAGKNASATFLREGVGVLNVKGNVDFNNVSVDLEYHNGVGSQVDFVDVDEDGIADPEEIEGWNFLSNPYTSVFNWDNQVVLPGGLNTAIYVWDEASDSYTSYNQGAGSGNPEIAPFQGFWVQTNNTLAPATTLDFEAAARTPSASATPMYKTSPLDGMKLRVTDAAQHRDEMYIGFEMSSTVDFDGNWDARKLRNGKNVPNMFAEVLGQNYSICRVPEESITSFPVHLNDNNEGENMSIEADLDQLKAYDQVFLEDLKTNAMHDLYSGSYSFTNDTAFAGNRFVLHFSNSSTTVGLDDITTQAWYAYTSDEGIHINLGNLENANVELYDMAGKKVMEASTAEGSVLFPVNMAKAIYVVRVSTDSSTETQKVIK